MAELEEERAAVKATLDEALQIDAWVWERDAGAQSRTIRSTYLDEVERCDLFIGIFWMKYGSYTIEEYEHAKSCNKPILVYEKRAVGVNREPLLEEFLGRVREVGTGLAPGRFTTVEELQHLLKQDVPRELQRLIRVAAASNSRHEHREPPELAAMLLSPDAVLAESALRQLLLLGPDCLPWVIPPNLTGRIGARFRRRRIARLVHGTGDQASPYLAKCILGADTSTTWHSAELAARSFPEVASQDACDALDRALPVTDALRNDPRLEPGLTRSLRTAQLAILALARTRSSTAASHVLRLAHFLSDHLESAHEYYAEKFGWYVAESLLMLSDRAVERTDQDDALRTLAKSIGLNANVASPIYIDYDSVLAWCADSLGARAVDPFVSLAASSSDPAVVSFAICVLMRLRSDRSRAVLQALSLRHELPQDTRTMACLALAEIGGSDSFHIVRRVFGDMRAEYYRTGLREQCLCLLGVGKALARLAPWGGDDALDLVNADAKDVTFGTKPDLIAARAYLGGLSEVKQARLDPDPDARAMCAFALGRQEARDECISLLQRMSAEAGSALERIAAEAGLCLQRASDGSTLHDALVQGAELGDAPGELLEHLTHATRREIIDALATANGPNGPLVSAWALHLGVSQVSVTQEVALLRSINGRRRSLGSA